MYHSSVNSRVVVFVVFWLFYSLLNLYLHNIIESSLRGGRTFHWIQPTALRLQPAALGLSQTVEVNELLYPVTFCDWAYLHASVEVITRTYSRVT